MGATVTRLRPPPPVRTVAAEDVARAVHDVASPLTVLVGLCFALRRRGADAATIADIGRIEAEVGRISDRLEALTNLARDGGTRAAPPHIVGLSAVVRGVVARASTLADQAGAALLITLDGDALSVRGDARALEVAIENLVGNALRHAGSGGTVWVAASRRGTEAVLHVADDGLGVHPGDRARIFRAHVRGRDARGAGQGLGLAIARDTARRHQGALVLEPSGRGAVFRLSLPLANGGVSHVESGAA